MAIHEGFTRATTYRDNVIRHDTPTNISKDKFRSPNYKMVKETVKSIQVCLLCLLKNGNDAMTSPYPSSRFPEHDSFHKTHGPSTPGASWQTLTGIKWKSSWAQKVSLHRCWVPSRPACLSYSLFATESRRNDCNWCIRLRSTIWQVWVSSSSCLRWSLSI